jgi:hypothetical protein
MPEGLLRSIRSWAASSKSMPEGYVMVQVVIEFGSTTLGPVLDAMVYLIERPSVLEMELRSGGAKVSPATTGAIEGLAQKFTDREIAAVTFRTEFDEIRYGLILEPRFHGQDLSMWMGTVELTTKEWRPYWDKLLRFDELAFACVGDEEGVELNDRSLTVSSFPWNEWPVLAAALRANEGQGSEWIVHDRDTGTHGPVF